MLPASRPRRPSVTLSADVAHRSARRQPLHAAACRRWTVQPRGVAQHGRSRSATRCSRTPRAINRLNVYPVPDGDTGHEHGPHARRGGRRARAGAAPSSSSTVQGHQPRLADGGRGNCGVILCQILRGLVGDVEGRRRSSTATTVAEALEAASAAAYQAVLRPIEGTILTVVREAADARRRLPRPTAPASSACCAPLARPGKAALDNTPELLPVLKEAGVVDAGGAGFLLLLDAALHVVDGAPLPEPDEGDGPDALEQLDAGVAAPRARRRRRRQRAALRGHVLPRPRRRAHRGVQGRVGRDRRLDRRRRRRRPLELPRAHQRHRRRDRGRARPRGRPQQIRVTDLFEQVAEEHAGPRGRDREARRVTRCGGPGCRRSRCAVVAVASGDGLAELFGQLGVQGVVTGGQTMNPSTAELLDAVER